MHHISSHKKLYTHDFGAFAKVTGESVLIYWPHGFGDWVQFSYILPLLNRSNSYFMTRFNDDTAFIMDESKYAAPLFLGTLSDCADGASFSCHHFGIEANYLHVQDIPLKLPASLFYACDHLPITSIFYSQFFESFGSASYPFHSKARSLLEYVVLKDSLENYDLSMPLRSAVSFDVPAVIQQWVESRAINFLGLGARKLCLIGHVGYTATNKNWGNLWRDEDLDNILPYGEECRDFMRLMLKKDPNRVFLSMEDRIREDDRTLSSTELCCATYAEVFGEIGAAVFPFGLVAKALMNVADLHVGVPAGPHHLAMVKPGLPCVGIWIDHFPSWYDEPKEESIHIISKNVVEKGYMDRPGSFTEMGGLKYDCRFVDTRRITGQQVMDAVEELL